MYFFGQRISQSHGDTTFHLHFRSFGVYHNSNILSANHPLDIHVSAAFIHFHFRHERHICAGIDSAGNSVPSAAGCLDGLPSKCFCRSLQHVDHPFVLQVLETKLERIRTGFGSHQIQMQVSGIGVGVVGRCSPWADIEGMMFPGAATPPAVDSFLVMRNLVELFTSPHARVVDVIIPEGDGAGAVEPGFDFNNGCRPKGVVKKLFRSTPSHLNRFAGAFRQTGRFQSLPGG